MLETPRSHRSTPYVSQSTSQRIGDLSVDDEELGSNLRCGSVCLRVIRHLVARPGGEPHDATIGQRSVHLSL